MFQKELTLAKGDKLTLQWEHNYHDLRIVHDQQTVAEFPQPNALMGGRRVALADGRHLTLVVRDGGLEVWSDGVELMSGIPSGGVDYFKRGVNWLLGLGGFQIVVGLILLAVGRGMSTEWAGVDAEGPLVLGIAVMVSGGILVGLGLWARSSQSNTPLWIGFGFAILNILMTLLSGKIGGIVISGLMAHALYKGATTGSFKKQQRPAFGEGGPLDADL